MRTVITSPGVIEQLMFDHPGSPVELTSEAAFLTLGPVTYYALLGGEES